MIGRSRIASRLATLVVAAWIGSTAIGCKPKPAALAPHAGYVVAPDRDFEFALPSGWTELDLKTLGTPGNAAAVAAQSPPEGPKDAFRENVNVVVVGLSSSEVTAPLDGLVATGVKAAKAKLNASQEGGLKTLQVDGLDARQSLLAFDVRRFPLRARQTFVRRGRRMYIITYSSTLNSLGAMNAAGECVLRSWRFAE